MNARRVRGAVAVLAALAITTLATACGGTETTGTAASARRTSSPRSGSATSPTSPTPPALVGVEKGFFAEAPRQHQARRPARFNAGPAAIEALFAGAIDATYIGPNPAINACAKSKGEAIRIVAGVDVRRRRTWSSSPRSTAARTSRARRSPRRSSATPRTSPCATGCRSKGLKTDTKGGGDVSIVPQENAQTLQTVRDRRHRRRLGARAVRHPPGPARARARSSSTSATCGRTSSSSPPT